MLDDERCNILNVEVAYNRKRHTGVLFDTQSMQYVRPFFPESNPNRL